jgi:hypothetical protein
MLRYLFCNLFLAVTLLSATAALGAGFEIEPFLTANRSPLVQIFGLPSETSSSLVLNGSWKFSLTQDIASIYSAHSNPAEEILLDGELYRWSFRGQYGVTDNLEIGIEIPLLIQGGGFLDGFIVDWHKLWGLPQGGRDTAAKNRLNYRYRKNGVQLLNINKSSEGVGDISLLSAYRLFENNTDLNHTSVALRSQLKLPTGDSSTLAGSGSVDLALFLAASFNHISEYGVLGLFASAGTMFGNDGDILKEQRENIAGFGTVGAGWSPADWIALKSQCLISSPLYKDSSLAELGKNSALLTIGGTIHLPRAYMLDIGVSEDLAVSTAPDVTFHIGLTKRF